MNNTDFFDCALSRKEKLWGAIWLLFEVTLFSDLLQNLNRLLPTPFPQSELNFVFFCINFTVVAFLLRNYLFHQLQLVPQLVGKIFLAAAVGFAAYLLLGVFLMFVLDYSNPFYMVEPALDGTIFTVWVIAPIYMAVYGLILWIVELVRRRKTTNK
jgi:hypothetical protein